MIWDNIGVPPSIQRSWVSSTRTVLFGWAPIEPSNHSHRDGSRIWLIDHRRRRAGLLVLLGTRKGCFLIHGDKSRRTWELSGPYSAGTAVFHAVYDPRGPGTVLTAVLRPISQIRRRIRPDSVAVVAYRTRTHGRARRVVRRCQPGRPLQVRGQWINVARGDGIDRPCYPESMATRPKGTVLAWHRSRPERPSAHLGGYLGSGRFRHQRCGRPLEHHESGRPSRFPSGPFSRVRPMPAQGIYAP